LTYASPGVGTSSQLTVELLKQHANINIRHIPFTGSDRALNAALSGATDIAALSSAGLIHYIQAGELKALAQTGKNRWDELPDVPTMAEIGVPDAVLMTSVVFLAPARTPSMIITRLARQVQTFWRDRKSWTTKGLTSCAHGFRVRSQSGKNWSSAPV
jgi:tripartite-type tricarboxylate transporter receptor subunit TctC